MRAKFIAFAAATVWLTTLSGCATTLAENKSLLFDPSYAALRMDSILVSEDSLPGRQYWRVAFVEAIAPIPALPDAQPSKEPVKAALRERARKVGADAIINVTYSTGINLTTGYYLEAKGIAVKLVE